MSRRSNPERSDATRAALLAAARRLFVEKGYAATSTPEIVAAAQVTRGALYHHFRDKADLFLAVARQAAAEVTAEIARQTRQPKSPLDALTRGAEAYFAAMAGRGRARLLLLDAPTVLPQRQILELNDLAGGKELRAGLGRALGGRAPFDELTTIIGAAFDRAALAIANGEPAAGYKSALRLLLTRLAG